MSKRKRPAKGDDYDIGYAKPPRATQFVPGQSGFKGRKHKKVEAHDQMISRVLNEVVEVGGQKMTKLTLAVHQAVNQTIKSGKARDLKTLLEMLDKYGVMTKVDQAEEARIAAEETMLKITTTMTRLGNMDPKVIAAGLRADAEEAAIIMGCSHCAPILRKRWKDPEYRSRMKKGVKSKLHGELVNKEIREMYAQAWERTPPNDG